MKSTAYLFNLCFVVSGLSGLVYEVLWTRYLGLFIGNSTFAHAVVLSSFMGGLALGNLAFGSMADRRGDHLKLYGIIEILIGIYAICTPVIYIAARYLYISIASHFEPGSTTSLLLKILFSCPLVIVPSMLMGGTLPIMVKSFSKTHHDVQKSVATLYALNSFGAVIGSLISAFYLIPKFGLASSLQVAALLNIFCGLTAFAIAAIHSRYQVSFSSSNLNLDKAEMGFGKKLPPIAWPLKVLLWSAFFAGLTGMFYEVAWFRFFALVLGSSTYSFSLMLAAFISGITIGSLILRSYRPQNNFTLARLLIICQTGIAIIMATSLLWYERVPFIFGMIKKYFAENMTKDFLTFEIIKYGFCFSIMLVPTLFFGIFLPLATSVISSEEKSIGKSVGKIFAFNTLGGVIGGAVAGFLLLPVLGLKNAFAFTALINAFTAILLALRLPREERGQSRARVYANCALLLVIVVGCAAFSEPWMPTVLSSGVFRKTPEFDTFKEFKEFEVGKKVLFSAQGPDMMVLVGVNRSGQGRFLKVNGKTDASTSGDEKTQVLLAQVPGILHPNPKRVLNIGLGSGQTVGGLLQHDEIERLDISELSRDVEKASRFFDSVNHEYWKDPRAKIFIEDAKNYLAVVKQKYDIVVSEPSNPWVSGVSSLFTQEFFELVKDNLNEDGMLVQWFHVYEMSDDTAKMIVRTITKVFPHVSIWWAKRGVDVMFVATKQPLSVDFAKMQEKIARPKIIAELKRAEVYSLIDFLKLELTGTKATTLLGGTGEINSDFWPRLEYEAPKGFFYGQSAKVFSQAETQFSRYKQDLLINKYYQIIAPVN